MLYRHTIRSKKNTQADIMERDQEDIFWSLLLSTAPPQNDLRKIMFENYAVGGIIYKMRYKERKCKIVAI